MENYRFLTYYLVQFHGDLVSNKLIEIGVSVGSVILFIALLIAVNSMGLTSVGSIAVLLLFVFIMSAFGIWLANREAAG